MSDEPQHIHAWSRQSLVCACGAPVPDYLKAAWDRYAEKTAE